MKMKTMYDELKQSIELFRDDLQAAFNESGGKCFVDVETSPVFCSDDPEISVIFEGYMPGVFSCGCECTYESGESVNEFIGRTEDAIREKLRQCGYALTGNYIDGYEIERIKVQ